MYARRTLRGLRADHGNMKQAEIAKHLGVSTAAYNAYEQVLDDDELIGRVGDLFGVDIKVTISERTSQEG